jgi:hypothetical protein
MIEHVLSHPYSYFYISRDDLRASSSLRLPLTSFPLLAYDQTSATLLTFGHFATPHTLTMSIWLKIPVRVRERLLSIPYRVWMDDSYQYYQTHLDRHCLKCWEPQPNLEMAVMGHPYILVD